MRCVFIIYLMLWLIRCEGRLFRVLWLLHEILVGLNHFYSILVEIVWHRIISLYRGECSVFWLWLRLAYGPSFFIVFTRRSLPWSTLLVNERRAVRSRIIAFKYKQVTILVHYHALIAELTISMRFKLVRPLRPIRITKLRIVHKYCTLICCSFIDFTFFAYSWKCRVVY